MKLSDRLLVFTVWMWVEKMVLCHRKDVQHMLTVVRYTQFDDCCWIVAPVGNWIVFWQSIRLSVIRSVA